MTKLMTPKWQVNVTGVSTIQKIPGLREKTSLPRSAGEPTLAAEKA